MRRVVLIAYCQESRHEPLTHELDPLEIALIPQIGEIYINKGFGTTRQWKVLQRQFTYEQDLITVALICAAVE